MVLQNSHFIPDPAPFTKLRDQNAFSEPRAIQVCAFSRYGVQNDKAQAKLLKPGLSSGELLWAQSAHANLVQLMWDKFLGAAQPIRRLEYFGSEDLLRAWEGFPGQLLQLDTKE